tara:strand:+ start:10990 stop:11214 length:225 start_codon:yes stop_codon:yes gene_type:complete
MGNTKTTEGKNQMETKTSMPRMNKVAKGFAIQFITNGMLDTYGTEWAVKNCNGEIYSKEIINQVAEVLKEMGEI